MGFEIFVTEEELRSREVKDKRFPTLKSLLTNLLKEKFFAHSWSWADELLNYQKISTEDAYDKSCCLWLVPNYREVHFLEDFMKSVLENICKFKVTLIPIN